MYLFKEVMLERGLDLTVRELRINDYEAKWGDTASFDEIKAGVCANTPSISNCDRVLNLTTDDVNNLRTPNWGQAANGAACVDRSKVPPEYPTPRWNTGGNNHVIVIRACWIYEPMFPTFGIAAEAPLRAVGDDNADPNGVSGVGVLAVSAFAVEP
jgi:hypothetical protein